MKRILRCKRFFKAAAFLILSCVLPAGFTSCPNSTGSTGGNNQPAVAQVKITVKGDNNVTVKTSEFKVDRGTKWEAVKKNAAITGIVFKGNFKLSAWKLKNAAGSALTDSYVFNADTTVFAVSKKGSTPSEEVTITVQGDDNVESGKGTSFKVNKGTKWQAVKTKTEITGITFKDGFEFSEWKLNNAAGSALTDTYVFNADTTVFAVSKMKAPAEKITITVHGDENILSGKGGSFSVDKGIQWSSVKTNAAVTNIKFKDGFELSEWKLNNSAGEKLVDNYTFTANTTIFAASKKIAIGKVIITIQGDENVLSGKGASFSVNKGTKWNAVKTNTSIKGITFKDGFELSAWRLNNAVGSVLNDDYAFNTDTIVFAVSKNKIIEKVTITVQGDNNVLSGKGGSFSVDKGTQWSSVKTNVAVTNITFKNGFELSVWKLNDSAGEDLTDNYTFTADTTVFAVSRNSNTVQKIRVTVQGDDKILTGKGASFTVDKGTTWATVKTNAAITSITFKEKYHLDVWKIDNADGAVLTDDYAFNEDKTVFALSTRYRKVKYAELDNYMNVNASETELNYIEVTDIEAENLKGSDSPGKSSALGKILNKYTAKNIALKLPKTITNLTDMSFCFFECTTIKSLAFIPEGVINAGSCFAGCKNLIETPAIPQGVTDMNSCFLDCENITAAPVIPQSVTNMFKCFSGCEKLTEAPVIPVGVTNMNSCFSNCKNITAAPAIPQGVINMNSCFSGCENITAAPIIPQGVVNMGACFSNCTKLTAAPAIPESVTNMMACFRGCTALITVPNSIPKNAVMITACFMNCTSLKGVTLDCKFNNGTFMMTFRNCTSLENGGIKVKQDHLQEYQNHAMEMGTTADKFAAQQ